MRLPTQVMQGSTLVHRGKAPKSASPGRWSYEAALEGRRPQTR